MVELKIWMPNGFGNSHHVTITSNGPDLLAPGQRLCSVACCILGLGLGFDNWFCCCLSVCRSRCQALVRSRTSRGREGGEGLMREEEQARREGGEQAAGSSDETYHT